MTALQDEINKTLDFLIQTDNKIYGKVSKSTKKAIKVQKGIDKPKLYQIINKNNGFYIKGSWTIEEIYKGFGYDVAAEILEGEHNYLICKEI